jgi:glycosyltransferase involved in cell wall biosynthesis
VAIRTRGRLPHGLPDRASIFVAWHESAGLVLVQGTRDFDCSGAMKSSSPLLSIVTVTLNAGKDLASTVQSVAEQTFTGYEHLIKDGGSHDGSIQDLQGSARLSLLVETDAGIYDAMNQAILACRGAYVLFLNAGDRFTSPGTLALVAGALASGSADLMYCDFIHGELNLKMTNPRHLTPFYLFRTNICHQACFYRRSCFDSMRFDTSFRIAADHDFLARAVLTNGIRSEHLSLTAIWYKGSGFSRRPDVWTRHRAELARIRSRYFTPLQRLAFAVMLGLTLPQFRRAIQDVPFLRPLRRPYSTLVNAAYSLAARARRLGINRDDAK